MYWEIPRSFLYISAQTYARIHIYVLHKIEHCKFSIISKATAAKFKPNFPKTSKPCGSEEFRNWWVEERGNHKKLEKLFETAHNLNKT